MLIPYSGFTMGPTLPKNLLRQQGPLSSPPLLMHLFLTQSKGAPIMTTSPSSPSLSICASLKSSLFIYLKVNIKAQMIVKISHRLSTFYGSQLTHSYWFGFDLKLQSILDLIINQSKSALTTKMSRLTLNPSIKNRNIPTNIPSTISRNGGTSLAKGAYNYSNFNQHNNGNSSVHKQYKNYNQINNYPYSNQSKDTISKIQQSSYEREQEEKRERERQNVYRIREAREKRDDYNYGMASSEPNYGKISSENIRVATTKRVEEEAKNNWTQYRKEPEYNNASSIRAFRPDSTTTSKSRTLGLVGLNNIGNTCFMNSILQCMLNLPNFNDYFMENRHSKQMTSRSQVALAYGKLVQLIKTSSSRSETPSQIKSAVAARKTRFSGYAQQDAQEFLTALLELLSLDLNRSKNPKYKELTADLAKQSLQQISQNWWNYNRERQNSVVCDFFTGQLLSKVICSTCRNQSIAFDNTWDFALNFSYNDNGDLMKMLQNFIKEQTISSDYYCSKCKAFRQCKRKLDFYRLPSILVLQIKRFSYGKYSKQKLNSRIKVSLELNMSKLLTFTHHPSTKNPTYKLVGVVNHSGDINFGHYTAECRNPINNLWYNFNDSSVSQTRMSDNFQSSSPYLLFYSKDE